MKLTPEEKVYIARLIRADIESRQRLLYLEMELNSPHVADIRNGIVAAVNTIEKLKGN